MLVSLLITGGCTTDSGKNEVGEVPGRIYSATVNLPEGKSVVCVVWSGNSQGEGGLSCDWNNNTEDPCAPYITITEILGKTYVNMMVWSVRFEGYLIEKTKKCDSTNARTLAEKWAKEEGVEIR